MTSDTHSRIYPDLETARTTSISVKEPLIFHNLLEVVMRLVPFLAAALTRTTFIRHLSVEHSLKPSYITPEGQGTVTTA
jgi:hypothetical protein